MLLLFGFISLFFIVKIEHLGNEVALEEVGLLANKKNHSSKYEYWVEQPAWLYE